MGDDSPPPELDLEQIEVMAENMGMMMNELMARGFSQDNATKIICVIMTNAKEFQ